MQNRIAPAPAPPRARTVGLGLVACAAALLCAPRPCAAATDPEEVYQAALAEFRAGQPSACAKFAESRRLKPDSTAALQGLAQCYDKFGKTASAWARYRELTVELKSHGDPERAQLAAARADELGKILSTVRIKLESPDTPGLILRLDKEEVLRVMFGTKMNVDPGTHVLEATAPGYEVWQTTLVIGPTSETRDVQIPALAAKSDHPPPAAGAPAWGPQRFAGLALGGAGIVGMVVGAVFGLQAISNKNASNADNHCDAADLCDSTGKALRADSIHAGNISTGLFAAGGALLVGGVVVFATAKAGRAPSDAGLRTGLVVGPGALSLRGSW